MNVGKTLFAQVMDFIPWTSFARIVNRYSGNAGVRRMNCAEQFRVMAFAQLTWRESLRDIEVTLGANAHKLYAMGLRHDIRRSTLADANDSRDWRIWFEVATLLIRRARKLYRDDDLELDLSNTVYALDSTTIDLCLSLFDWAPFRSTKAAVKMHTLLDLRGNIPAFIHGSADLGPDCVVLIRGHGDVSQYASYRGPGKLEGSNISLLSARHRDAYRGPNSHHDDHELATEARDAGFGAVVA